MRYLATSRNSLHPQANVTHRLSILNLHYFNVNYMDIQKKLGERIRQLREKHGWSQEDFAEKTSLHRTYVSGIERGTRNPTLTVLKKIADGFEVPLNKLVEGLNSK